MDREFMREYYRNYYSNPQGVAVKESELYQEKRNNRYVREEEFTDTLVSVASELYPKFDNYLDAYADEMEVLLEEMYLLGASDREKMLRGIL